MRKLTCLTVLLVGAMLCLTTSVQAQSSSAAYQLSVNIDNASTATFLVYQIDTGVFTEWAPTTLPFNPVLTEVTPGQFAYIGDVAYAIDVFPFGSGQLNVTLSYVNADPAFDLGDRSVGTPVVVTQGTPDTETARNVVGTQALLNSIAQTIFAADIAANGDYLRVYLGLTTGDPAVDPPGTIPFNPGDTPGTYAGTFTMTVAAP